jgi:hypothetical protein
MQTKLWKTFILIKSAYVILLGSIAFHGMFLDIERNSISLL